MNQAEKLKIIAVGGKTPDGAASELLRQGVDLATPESRKKLIIIPTAKHTAEKHNSSIARVEASTAFRGLSIDTLHGFDEIPSTAQIEDKLGKADIVYITGGDTKRMMEMWQNSGVAKELIKRASEGLVVTGISAGAIAQFTWGHSDWRHYYAPEDEEWDYDRIDGLGLVGGIAITPHANSVLNNGVVRVDDFQAMFEREQGPNLGLGLDNFAGIQINEGLITPISANPSSGVIMLHRDNAGVVTKDQMTEPIKIADL